MLALVLLGLVLRARGFLFDRYGLWLDEASWAIMLMRDPLETLMLRPIGFMALSKLFAVVFGPWEVVLRSLAWVAGVGVVLLAVPLARRLFRAPAAQLLFVAIVALHPAAIDLTKEFKPYECSLFGHVALLYLTLRYLESQRAADLVLGLVAAFVTNLFAQDMVMAYPGVFLVLGADVLRHRRERVPWVVAGAGAVLLLLFAQYWFLWRNMDAGESAYWGNKYGVFYTPSSQQSFASWWVERYVDLTQFPGLRHRYWEAPWVSASQYTLLRSVDDFIWLAVHVVGCARLVMSRRYAVLILLVMPIVTTSVMNALGHWPFGVFRTNLFMVGYMAAIAGMAVETPRAVSARWLALVPAVVLVVLPLVLFDRWWNARKRALAYDSEMPRVLEQLTTERPPLRGRVNLVLSRRACEPYEYYATVHPATSRRYNKELKRTYSVHCFPLQEKLAPGIVALTPEHDHAWLLTDMRAPEIKELRASIPGVVALSRFHAYPMKLLELVPAQNVPPHP